MFKNINYKGVSLLLIMLQTGCTKAPSHDTSTVSAVAGHAAITANHDNVNTDKSVISPLIQCNRDLESLRTVDAGQYRKFQAEYDSLMKTSSGFLSVKDDVSPEVAALARPRFQFALVNICYRIKDTLAQTLIRQAGGEK